MVIENPRTQNRSMGVAGVLKNCVVILSGVRSIWRPYTPKMKQYAVTNWEGEMAAIVKKGGGCEGRRHARFARKLCDVMHAYCRKKPFQLESNFPPFLRVPSAVRDTTLETGSAAKNSKMHFVC
jgi:hypothetical protein